MGTPKGVRYGGKPKGYKAPKTLEKLEARKLLQRLVAEQIEPMTLAQMEAAKGAHQFVYRDDQGKFKVIDDPDELRARISLGQAIRLFTRLPSTSAYAYLLDQALDKAPQHLAVTGAEGGPVQMEIVVRKPWADKS